MKTAKFSPRLEPLDARSLPSASLVNGVLTVGGTAGSDAITISKPDADTVLVRISTTGEARRFAAAAVNAIDLRCGGGNDVVTVGLGLTCNTTIRGGGGHDTILGGGGSDTVLGSYGNDSIRGRGGDDDLRGEWGRDDLRGGQGDDSLDGGSGRDGCRGGDGDDDVRNGFDLDTELIAVFSGGQGDAEFKFGPEDGFLEREFEVEVEDLPAGITLGVFVDGVGVGTMRTDAFGDARLEYELDFSNDGGNDGAPFPAGFPEIHVGSVVQVKLGGTVVREGAFVVNPNP